VWWTRPTWKRSALTRQFGCNNSSSGSTRALPLCGRLIPHACSAGSNSTIEQYTVTQQDERLEENLGAARSAGVEAVDLLEATLQMYVHTGPWVVAAACETYKRVLEQCEETAGDVASEIASRSTSSIRTRPRHREHVVVRC
jgi:hypothetical protein